jgi:hypothetical protein
MILNLFWSMFIFFLWIIWIWILITVFIDIFRSHDLGGFAKALWFLFVLFIPAHRRAGLPDRPRRQDARAGGAAGSAARRGGPRLHPADRSKRTDQHSGPAGETGGPTRPGVIFAEEFEREKAKVLAAA